MRRRSRRPPATASRWAPSRRAGPRRSCTARSPPRSSPELGARPGGAAGDPPAHRRRGRHERRSRSACTSPTTWSPGRDFPGVDEVRELAATSLDRALGAAARLSLLDIIGRGRGVVPGALALYNETHAEDVRDTAATVCAAGVARGSSARRRGSSTCWRRRSRSPRCSAPGTWRAASPRTSRSPRRAGTSRPSSSRRPVGSTPVAALLVVQDPSGGDPGVYLVPPDLLLEGPNGEYVFAADAMATGTLSADLGRVVNAPIDAVYTVPVSDLGRWAGAGELQVALERPRGGRRERPHADGQGRRLRRRRRSAGDLLRRRDQPARHHRPAGRAGQVRARGGRSAAGRRARRPRRREPVAAGGAGSRRRSSAASRRLRRRGAVPRPHAGRRGAVRLRAGRRGDPGRHHAAVAGLPLGRDRAGAATAAARSAWARRSSSASPAST